MESWTIPANQFQIARYLPLWLKLFLEQNGMTETYFSKHFSVTYVGTTTDIDRQLSKPGERGREYIIVVGNLRLDWAQVPVVDELVIRDTNSDEYLSDEAIGQHKGTRISKYSPLEKLPFTQKQIQAFVKQTWPEITSWKNNSYKLIDQKDSKNGGIYTVGWAILDEANNKCAEISVDITSLKGELLPKPCIYY